MSDRTISFTCLGAVCLWGLACVLVFVGVVVALVGEAHLPIALGLMAYGFVAAAAAGTMSVRLMLKRHARFMKRAFDLGRDAGPSSVRSVR